MSIPERDPLALAMLAAWVNCPVDQLPATMRAHTCTATMAAWKRVGEAAVAFLNEEARLQGWNQCREAAREAFLNMIADAEKWEEDVDGDCGDDGRSVMYINYDLRTGHSQLQELCETIGIEPKRYDQTLFERIDELISEPSPNLTPSTPES